MKLFELLQNVVFPPNIRFVSQDADGVINMYHSDPGERSTDRYWTCHNFVSYLTDVNDEDIRLPVASDYHVTLLVVEKGAVVGLADGCLGTINPGVTPAPTEFTIKLCNEDFDYLHDGFEIAELTVGIVNQILKEQGIDISFDVEDSGNDED